MIKNPVACISTCLSHEVLSMCILPIDIYYEETKSQVQTYAMLYNCSQGTFIKESLINYLKMSGLTYAYKTALGWCIVGPVETSKRIKEKLILI